MGSSFAALSKKTRAHPKVAPATVVAKGAVKRIAAAGKVTEGLVKQTADNLPVSNVVRSTRDVCVGAWREHSLLGYISAMYYGDGPRLATIAQASQIFWGSCMVQLAVTILQLRYSNFRLETTAGSSTRFYMLVGLLSAMLSASFVLIARLLFGFANSRERCENKDLLPMKASWCFMMGLFVGLGFLVCILATQLTEDELSNDMFPSWGFTVLWEWLTLEPFIMSMLGCFNLFVRWCTSGLIEDDEMGVDSKAKQLESSGLKTKIPTLELKSSA